MRANLSATDTPDLVAVLHALADPTRLAVVRTIANQGGFAVGPFNVPVSRSTMTHHFRVLENAHILRSRRVGYRRLHELQREPLENAFPGLLTAVIGGAADRPAGIRR
jgi:DNA-binding transcriptional ArsR family regulator